MNDPVNYVDDEGTYALWFILKKTGNFGFVHRCVAAEIENNYPGILTEVVVPKYVPYLDRTVNYRADVVEQATGSVWEIKHAAQEPMFRIWEALCQIEDRAYIGQKGIGANSHVQTSQMGAAGRFAGAFTISCDGSLYCVEYYTPVNGAILYSVQEISQKEHYLYAYNYYYDYNSKIKKSMLNSSSFEIDIDWRIAVIACAGGASCGLSYGDDWLSRIFAMFK